jgi:hypothetical protein
MTKFVAYESSSVPVNVIVTVRPEAAEMTPAHAVSWIRARGPFRPARGGGPFANSRNPDQWGQRVRICRFVQCTKMSGVRRSAE